MNDNKNKDWIEESKNVANELRVNGFAVEAKQITEAIESGATGGEILFSLRWHINALLKSKKKIDLEIMHSMKEIVQGITNTIDKIDKY